MRLRMALAEDRLDRLRWLVTLLPACAVFLVEIARDQVLGEAGGGVAGAAVGCAAALVVSYAAARVAFGALDRARRTTRARSLEVEALDALVRERERLGRELHDGTAQLLAFLLVRTETVGQLVRADRPGEALAELEQLRAAADDLYADVRESISGLRTRVIDRGLAGALREYAADMADRSDLDVTLDVDEVPGLAPVAAFNLLRVAQEALANVRKHAGARSARVSLRRSPPGTLSLAVEDGGRGFDPAAVSCEGAGPRRFGLETMRERVEAMGGRLEVDSGPGRGTRVVATVPLPGEGRS